MDLPQGFAGALAQMQDWLRHWPESWHLINLGPNKHKIFSPCHRFQSGKLDFELTRAHYFPMTTTGLIWSRSGAQAFLAAHQRIFAPVDNYFRHWLTRSDQGRASWPPLVTTTGADSEITASSGPRRSAQGRHPLYGLFKQQRLMGDKLIAMRHRRSRAKRG